MEHVGEEEEHRGVEHKGRVEEEAEEVVVQKHWQPTMPLTTTVMSNRQFMVSS